MTKNLRKAIVKDIKIGTVAREHNGYQDFTEYHQRDGILTFFNYEKDKPYFFQCIEHPTVYHESWLDFEYDKDNLFNF